MLEQITTQLPSLGISGLLFIMWWYERQERTRSASATQEALKYTSQMADVNDHLLDVIRGNTEALSALREELRSHRLTETEWLSRLSRQIEKLSAA
jgi:hypothetical protein